MFARTLIKAGSSPQAVRRRFDEYVQKAPKVSGASEQEQVREKTRMQPVAIG